MKLIVERRLELGLTQEELAKRIGVTRKHLSKIENNTAIPSNEVKFKLASVLKICPYALMELCKDCNFKNKCENFF